jgi:diaminopimelate epimerase
LSPSPKGDERLPFSKWEGLGNDFVFVDGEPPADASRWAVQICDRHRGVGADGLAFVSAEPRMVLFNSDGSRAAMCGNAVRCIAAGWHRTGKLAAREWTALQTDSGPRRLRVLHQDWVEVDMGRPEPMPGLAALQPVEQVGLPGHFLSMGNPHLVFLCPGGLPSQADFARWGEALQTAPGIPDGGINVEFAARKGERLELLVWERGAGPTLACGTGACAAAVAAVEVGWMSGTIPVHLPGGVLHISWDPAAPGGVLMGGPAREVFRGEWLIPE